MPTYALIPGGGGDPWEWHRLVPELAARGHEAVAIRLPSEDETAGDAVIYYHDLPAVLRNPRVLADRLEAYRRATREDRRDAGR